MYKRYYSPFEEQPITKQQQGEIIKPKKVEKVEEKEEQCPKPSKQEGVSNSISTDDVMLIIILLLLLTEEKENKDKLRISAIVFLLLMEYIEK